MTYSLWTGEVRCSDGSLYYRQALAAPADWNERNVLGHLMKIAHPFRGSGGYVAPGASATLRERGFASEREAYAWAAREWPEVNNIRPLAAAIGRANTGGTA